MSVLGKKFLVIMEINNILFYLNNPKTKVVNHALQQVPIKYNDSYKHLEVSVRKGKG